MKQEEFNELAVQLCEAAKSAIMKDVKRLSTVAFEDFVYNENIKQLEDIQLLGKDVDEAQSHFEKNKPTWDDVATMDSVLDYLNEPTIYNIFKTDDILLEFEEKMDKDTQYLKPTF